MTNPKTILNAWKEVFKNNTSDEHRRRSKICMDCPASKYSTFLNLVKDDLKEIQGMKCMECGCPLSPKIRSTVICHKWKVPTK